VGAAAAGNSEAVDALIGAGDDVNTRPTSCSGGRAILNPKGATPFLYASRTADVPLMKVFIEPGVDPLIPNAEGSTP